MLLVREKREGERGISSYLCRMGEGKKEIFSCRSFLVNPEMNRKSRYV